MMFVDTFTLSSLVLLNLYDNGMALASKGYDIYQFSYGSLASTLKIEPTASTYHIDFTPTQNLNPTTINNVLVWTYIDPSLGSSVITINTHKTGATNNYISGILTLTGVYTLLA